MPSRRISRNRSTNYEAASQLIDALVEIASLLRSHLSVAASDSSQNWTFLAARMEVINRILIRTNRRLLNVVDLSYRANKLGRDVRKRWKFGDSIEKSQWLFNAETNYLFSWTTNITLPHLDNLYGDEEGSFNYHGMAQIMLKHIVCRVCIDLQWLECGIYIDLHRTRKISNIDCLQSAATFTASNKFFHVHRDRNQLNCKNNTSPLHLNYCSKQHIYFTHSHTWPIYHIDWTRENGCNISSKNASIIAISALHRTQQMYPGRRNFQ